MREFWGWFNAYVRKSNYCTIAFSLSDDDRESGYLSPGSDSSRSQGQQPLLTNNFAIPGHKVTKGLFILHADVREDN